MLPRYLEEAFEKALIQVKTEALVELNNSEQFWEAVSGEVQKALNGLDCFLHQKEDGTVAFHVFPLEELDANRTFKLEEIANGMMHEDNSQIEGVALALEVAAKKLRAMLD